MAGAKEWISSAKNSVANMWDDFQTTGFGQKLADQGGYINLASIADDNGDDLLTQGVGNTIKTPYGNAIQEASEEALLLKDSVSNGAYVYRAGQFGRSNVVDAQFWSAENPLSYGYANKYGVDFENVDYIIRGTIKPGANLITRYAPGLGTNIGGGLEIITDPFSVYIDSFYMP